FEFLRNRQLLSPDQSLHETAMPNYTWGDLIQLLDDYLKANSSLLEPPVGDDFCGDCGNKFEPGESKVYSGNSAVYGEYFPKSDTPICDKCAELRYTEHILKVERDIEG